MFLVYLEPVDRVSSFSNLRIKIFTSSNKWVICSSKSLSLSNKIEILAKLSKDTNKASSSVQAEPCLPYTCSSVCDVINFISDFKLIKTINGNYSNVADNLITIFRSVNCSSLGLYNMETPIRKIATQMICTRHFSSVKLPPKKIPTQDNSHQDNSLLKTSHLG